MWGAISISGETAVMPLMPCPCSLRHFHYLQHTEDRKWMMRKTHLNQLISTSDKPHKDPTNREGCHKKAHSMYSKRSVLGYWHLLPTKKHGNARRCLHPLREAADNWRDCEEVHHAVRRRYFSLKGGHGTYWVEQKQKGYRNGTSLEPGIEKVMVSQERPSTKEEWEC